MYEMVMFHTVGMCECYMDFMQNLHEKIFHGQTTT